MVEDCRRFILSYGAVIQKGPLQIYYLALVTSPSKGLLKDAFRHEVPDWIQVYPVDEEWDDCLQTLESLPGADGVKSMAYSLNMKHVASAVGE